jgi:dienelactone hydrolase
MKKSILYFPILFLFACGGNAPESVQVENASDSTETEESQMSSGPNIVGEEVAYEADGITMNGYLVYDANREGDLPGVVVVHEWWGNNEHTRNSARKLAEEGYVALAVDMYGDGKKAKHPKDAKAFSSAVMKDFDGAKARFKAALDVVKNSAQSDSTQLAAIGYCFGGGVVLNMARQGVDLDAVATFHGSLGPVETAKPGSVEAKLLVMNGADDPFVSSEAIESFKEEMNNAGAEFEFINYPGAVHAFTNPAATKKGEEFDLPLAYNEEADEKSWSRLLEFLDSTFSEGEQ